MMRAVGRITLGSIVAFSLVLPLTVSAQAPSAPRAARTDVEKVRRGEAWFYQSCLLCHVDRILKNDITAPLGPKLNGLLKDATPAKEAAVREQINRNSLRMPGYRYNLTPEQMDELIAYLKTL